MKTLLRLTIISICAALTTRYALAGPGAHGPNGEHLDRPAPVLSAGNSVPRVEAKSELFELVARVEGGVLSVLIDRYDSNEPVLDASVEVEAGSWKQKAVFRREQGDYTVNNPDLVRLLSSPGSHSLVFTVGAGKDSDLLEGALRVAGPEAGDGATHPRSYGALAAWIGGSILIAGTAGALFRRRRSTRMPRFLGGTRSTSFGSQSDWRRCSSPPRSTPALAPMASVASISTQPRPRMLRDSRVCPTAV
jgi:hypothetical protein